MKNNKVLTIIFLMLTMNGCVVQSTYSKTVAVTKDAEGRVIQTVESETVVQPANGYPLRLEKIKGVQP
jgi:PBP1b-binding outer membrane lipoprotein LpoB